MNHSEDVNTIESSRCDKAPIPFKKSAIVKSKKMLSDVRKRLLRNNKLYIINTGNEINTILKERIIYEESLGMENRHALTMFRNVNIKHDGVGEIEVDIKTSKLTVPVNGEYGYIKEHDYKCSARQKYEEESKMMQPKPVAEVDEDECSVCAHSNGALGGCPWCRRN